MSSPKINIPKDIWKLIIDKIEPPEEIVSLKSQIKQLEAKIYMYKKQGNVIECNDCNEFCERDTMRMCDGCCCVAVCDSCINDNDIGYYTRNYNWLCNDCWKLEN